MAPPFVLFMDAQEEKPSYVYPEDDDNMVHYVGGITPTNQDMVPRSECAASLFQNSNCGITV